MNINNALNIINNIPSDVLLVVVTKNQSKNDIDQLYSIGLRDFGENKLQSILEKKDHYNDVRWHFIGHIQTNKVKDIIKHCTLIHSVSSYKLLDKINAEALKQNVVQKCLIQFNIARELTKDGFEITQADDIFQYAANLHNIKIEGIMLMGPHTADKNKIKQVFEQGYNLQQVLVKSYPDCVKLSMGMSGDYELALENNSNILRIGSLLFE